MFREIAARGGKKTIVARTGGGLNCAAIGPDGKLYVCNSRGFIFRRHDTLGLNIAVGTTPDY